MESAEWRNLPVEGRYGRLLSCSAPCSGISFAGFVAASAGQPRFYWENRDDGVAFAGAGAAVELTAWGPDRFDKIAQEARALFAGAQLQGAGAALAGPRLFGGFSFRDDFTPDNTWSIYSPAYFVLPHYQLVSGAGRAGSAPSMWLTINAQIPPDESPDSSIAALKAALQRKIAQLQASESAPRAGEQAELLSINYPMGYPAWERMLNEATARIHAGALNKVVLARAAELRFSDRVKPAANPPSSGRPLCRLLSIPLRAAPAFRLLRRLARIARLGAWQAAEDHGAGRQCRARQGRRCR